VPDLRRADFTDLNERLARHYGIPEIYGTHIRRVTLPNSDWTSPVLRGKWLLDNIFGVYVPPPCAHGERFGAIQSANTLVGAPLVGDDDLVETESEAEMHVICG